MTGPFPFVMLAQAPKNPRLTFCRAACLAALFAAGVGITVQLWGLFAWIRGWPPYHYETLSFLELLRLMWLLVLSAGIWGVWRTFWSPAEVVVHRVCLAVCLTVGVVAVGLTRGIAVQLGGMSDLGARLLSAAVLVLFLSYYGTLYRLLAGRPLQS